MARGGVATMNTTSSEIIGSGMGEESHTKIRGGVEGGLMGSLINQPLTITGVREHDRVFCN